MGQPFIGEIKMWGLNFAPRGWALCNGQLLSVSQNTALFSLFGTNFGGDGRTTFGLPDLRGRAPLHVGGRSGTGPGLSGHFLGQRGGTETVTLNQNHLPAHTHTIMAGDDFSEMAPDNHVFGDRSYYQSNTVTDVSLRGEALSNTGGSQGHENRQPYTVLNFCVALVGTYPSRS